MIAVGDTLPQLSVTPDARQLFLFSSATHNGHRIHYDHPWATEVEGYPGLIIQGPLQEALMVRAITDWCGADGAVTSFSVQNRAAAFVGDTIVVDGTVAAVTEQEGGLAIELEIQAQNERGELLMPGRASVLITGGDRGRR